MIWMRTCPAISQIMAQAGSSSNWSALSVRRGTTSWSKVAARRSLLRHGGYAVPRHFAEARRLGRSSFWTEFRVIGHEIRQKFSSHLRKTKRLRRPASVVFAVGLHGWRLGRRGGGCQATELNLDNRARAGVGIRADRLGPRQGVAMLRHKFTQMARMGAAIRATRSCHRC